AIVLKASAWGMVLLYPVFVGELIWHRVQGNKHWKQHIWHCVLPPLRMGGKDHLHGRMIWLPFLGSVTADQNLRSRVERAFGVPMIFIALMVLPLMAVEHFWSDKIATSKSL